MPDQARTVALPGGRIGTLVEADDAGEWTIRVCDAGPDEWEGRGVLTWRQAEAMRHLGRTRKSAGLAVAWLRAFGGDERPEDITRAAMDEYAALMLLIREPLRARVTGMLASAEWSPLASIQQVRDAMDCVADRLKLAP